MNRKSINLYLRLVAAALEETFLNIVRQIIRIVLTKIQAILPYQCVLGLVPLHQIRYVLICSVSVLTICCYITLVFSISLGGNNPEKHCPLHIEFIYMSKPFPAWATSWPTIIFCDVMLPKQPSTMGLFENIWNSDLPLVVIWLFLNIVRILAYKVQIF